MLLFCTACKLNRIVSPSRHHDVPVSSLTPSLHLPATLLSLMAHLCEWVCRCWVNLTLIEPQHKLWVKLTEVVVFKGRGELKCFCTSILGLLPFCYFFYGLLWLTVSCGLSTSLLEMSLCKDCFFLGTKIKVVIMGLCCYCFSKRTVVTHVSQQFKHCLSRAAWMLLPSVYLESGN